jgi:hypothetical protein
MNIYDKPTITFREVERIAQAGGLWAVAPIAGAMTTRQLYQFFTNGDSAPEDLLSICRNLAADLRRKIESSEFIAARCWRWNTTAPDVTRAKYWLPVVEHWIERAESATAYWHARGGPQQRAERRASEALPAAPKQHRAEQSINIELKPVITVQMPTDPVPVIVKSMPARAKTTVFERDDGGDILSATQHEADVSADQAAA